MWLIFWRGMVGAVIIGGLVGFVIGFSFGLMNALLKTNIVMNPLYSGIPAAVVGVGWYLVVVRMALRKRYWGFRIALLPHSPY